MKDFAYYSTVDAELPDARAVRAAMVKEINDTPMTDAQRKEAMGEVAAMSRTVMAPAMEKYRTAQEAKMREFWQHCRDDLGYPSFLSKSACDAIESFAWDKGHSAGFGEVYGYLSELSELAKRIRWE